MPAQSTTKIERSSRLARRLVIYILLFSSVITLLATAYQLYAEFRRDIQAIHAGLDQVEKSHLRTIVSSAWVYDLNDLKSQLSGILQLPDVQYAEIKSDDGIIVSEGVPGSGSTISRHFELTREHRGQQIDLGTLSVSASLEGVHKRLIDRVVIIFSTQAIKTFLVTTFIFILFYYLIGRHLESMAVYTSSLNMYTLDKPFELGRHARGTQKDELDLVTHALNEMRARLLDGLMELKHSEAAIRESETKFRQLAENIPEVFWLGAADWQDIYYISPAYETIWGNSSDSLLRDPMSWFDSVHKEDQEMIEALFPIQWETPLTPFIFPEYRIVRPDGALRWIFARAFPIVNDEGNVCRVAGIAEDITDRKNAEIKIKDISRLLMEVTEGTTDAIFIKDLEGRYVMANSAACRAMGRGHDEVIGKTDRVLFPEASSEVIDANDSQVIRSGNHLVAEERLQTSEGDTIWLTKKSPHLDSDGNIVGIIGISRNITEMKKTAQEKEHLEDRLAQAQKMESIGNLAGGIAHDFNNLLFPIIGLSDLLLDDLPQGSLEYEHAQEILKAGKRGSELVKQILAFSRQSKHKMMPVGIQQVLKEALRLSRATIPSDIEITQDIKANCGLVLADPTQIHQIAMNLITNAYHALENPGGTIDVQLKEAVVEADNLADSSLPPGKYVMLRVSDTGCGIEAGIVDKIFEPYFTTKEQGKGTGLGLAVVYGLVKEHHGDIQVYSELGKGTTFIVYLPLIEKATESVRGKIGKKVRTGSERVLLVDDEEPIARLERLMLERLGYHVTSHVSSTEALEVFRSRPDAFDLVISDMTMPNLTGDQLAKELISIRSDIPIVICTGFSERITQEKATAFGIKGFLMKPIAISDMAQMVRRVLDEVKERTRQ